jgi:hypothetical protein
LGESPATDGNRQLVFVWILKHFFLYFHVSELVGVEYLATIQTLDVFNVLFPRYHADLWVFAGGVHLGGLSVQPSCSGQDCTRRIKPVKSVSVYSAPVPGI